MASEELMTISDVQESLSQQSQEVISQMETEQDLDRLKDLTYLFNVAQAKKGMIRAEKFGNLLDKFLTLAETRVDKQSDNFTNMELLNYLQTMQASIEKSIKQSEVFNAIPPIQVNQQNLSINLNNDFDRDSREKVLQTVNAILAAAKIGSQLQSITPAIIEADQNNEE